MRLAAPRLPEPRRRLISSRSPPEDLIAALREHTDESGVATSGATRVCGIPGAHSPSRRQNQHPPPSTNPYRAGTSTFKITKLRTNVRGTSARVTDLRPEDHAAALPARPAHPERGTIRVAGKDIADLSARELARLVAYVPQSTTTVFPFTTLDIAVMGRTPHLGVTATPSVADRRAALTTLRSLGIDHLADRVPCRGHPQRPPQRAVRRAPPRGAGGTPRPWCAHRPYLHTASSARRRRRR